MGGGAYGRFSDYPSPLMPVVYAPPGIAARVWVFARLRLCCLLLLWLCFEGKYSAVAGLVHALDSWKRCV